MTTTTKTRTNKYRARCGSCRLWVGAGAGSLAKVGSRWVVTCASCADDNADRDDDTRTWKQIHGRCEDAPACGCGGACGTPLGYGFSDYMEDAYAAESYADWNDRY
jgi:hypothetical protein